MTNTEDTINRFEKYVIPSYGREKVVFVRGKGTKLWDADGKVYLDFLAGISVLNTGHCHPVVVKAVQQQLEQLTHVSNLYYTENQGRLAERLSGLSLGGKCFFCNSGAEANEALIKLARLWGHEAGRYEVITMRNSFHGRTLATAAATGQDKVKKGFDPMPEGFVHADFNDIESVKSCISGKTAAVLVEAVQGEGGIIPASPEFMKDLRALCDEKGILMLCDEVQCGMGRTGNWFGFQAYDVQPDAISLAKALGSGYPMGAIVTSPKLSDVFQPGRHATTFGGTPPACAAALATLRVIEDEQLVHRSAVLGKHFMAGLQALVDKYEHLVEVRGRGLMVGLVLDQPAKPLQDRLFDMGLISLATAEKVLRFLPPLNTKDSEMEEALDMIADACEEWHAELSGVSAEGEAETEQTDQGAGPADDAGTDEG